MTLPTNADIDAAVPATGPKPRSDLMNALLKTTLAEISASRRDSSSPKDFGGDPSGVVDSTAAVAAVISAMNAGGVAGRFDGGIWRVTSALPQITRPIIVGDGSGEIFVDYVPAAGAAIFDAKIPIGEVYTVTAVDLGITYDASGTFTADSTVTRLTLSLAGAQAMPAVGAVGKLTGTNVLSPNENTTDQSGVHIEVLAVSGSFVYVPWIPLDTYSTGMQLIMLGTQPCAIEGVRFRGNFATVVSGDAKYAFLRVQGAIFDRLARLRFRDGCEAAIQRWGCFMGGTHNIRVAHMRSALLSEAAVIAGYGVVDAGCWQSLHTDMGGFDCRHLFTTVTLAPTADRVAWGRNFRPLVEGGQAAGCSAACFDTHPDAWEAAFKNCRAVGGYFGESGAPIGFQLRGGLGRVDGCSASDFQYGYQITKTVANEGGSHSVVNSRYDGSGIPVRILHDAALSAANARQRVFLGNLHLEANLVSTAGVFAAAADIELIGNVRVVTKNAANARGIELTEISSIRSAGGKLVFDCQQGINFPRPIIARGDGCGVPGLDLEVIAGAISWQGVISENENPAAVMAEVRIDCDADKAPSTSGGQNSSNGASAMLQPTSAIKIRGTVQRGRSGAPRTSSFTLQAFDHGRIIPVTATATVTVPAAIVLGQDFECQIAAFAAVTIDGPGATNTALTSGQSGRIRVMNGVVQTAVASNTVIS